MTVRYEAAVCVEDVKALTDEVVAVIRARIEHIPEGTFGMRSSARR